LLTCQKPFFYFFYFSYIHIDFLARNCYLRIALRFKIDITTNDGNNAHPLSIKKGNGNGLYNNEIFYVDNEGKMKANGLEVQNGKIVASEIDATSKIGTSDFSATNSIRLGDEDNTNKTIRMATNYYKNGKYYDACIKANSYSGDGTAIYLGALPSDEEDDGGLENLQYLQLQAERIAVPVNGVKLHNEWNFVDDLLFDGKRVISCSNSNGRMTLQYDGDRLAVYYNGNYVGSLILTS